MWDPEPRTACFGRLHVRALGKRELVATHGVLVRVERNREETRRA
jgi:hypothetical protein